MESIDDGSSDMWTRLGTQHYRTHHAGHQYDLQKSPGGRWWLTRQDGKTSVLDADVALAVIQEKLAR